MANLQLSIRQKLYLSYLFSRETAEFDNLKGKKKVVVTLAADYGNLGDVAITYAQARYLKRNFPDYEIVDFPISKTFKAMRSLKRVVNRHDIISIVGGGNLGDEYDDIEYCRQFVIKQFPNNRIISFPQTVHFSGSEIGTRARKTAIKVYSGHKYLTISTRERSSFEKGKEYFTKNNVVLLPDIVLYLNEENPKYERQAHITLCLRHDGEKLIGKQQETQLIEQLEKQYSIELYDTHINKSNLTLSERESELVRIWTAFKKSKLVITDRLHGMIFCTITRTPCIAIDNANHKISGVYDTWLKDLSYIKMVRDYDLTQISDWVSYFSDFNIDKSDEAVPSALTDKFQVLLREFTS